MSHPDPILEYVFEERQAQDEIERERLWRTLELFQKVRAANCLDEDELKDLQYFLGLSGLGSDT